MATGQDNQETVETQGETPVQTDETEQTATVGFTPEETEHCPCCCKKRGSCKYVAFLLLVAVAAVFGVRQSREAVLEKYRAVVERFSAQQVEQPAAQPETAAETARPAAETVQPAELSVRVEQLENQRDFDNADVIVATVEEKPDLTAGLSALEQNQQTLNDEIARLRSEIDALRAAMPKSGLIEERLLAVNARADAFEQKLVEESVKIERMERNKADASSVLSMMTRLEITERKLRASNAEKARAAALLLAVYQMRESAASGQSFLTEQQAALALASSKPRIAEYLRSLSVAADQGVWTKTALIQSFSAYADKAVLSESVSPKQDWFHQALNSLKKLVVIRRIDAVTQEDMSTQAVLARAQQAVNAGDLTVAVLHLQALRGTAADEMKEWTQAAQRYVTTQKTINETVAAVLGVLYAEQAKGE